MDVSIIVDPYVDEVIPQRRGGGGLGISILDVKRGLWRLREDPARCRKGERGERDLGKVRSV